MLFYSTGSISNKLGCLILNNTIAQYTQDRLSKTAAGSTIINNAAETLVSDTRASRLAVLNLWIV
jgi:hypothetical protein